MSETIKSRISDTDGKSPDKTLITTVLKDATEHEAYRQGRWAYSLGMESICNPYAGKSEAYQWWGEGWSDSQEENGDL